MNQTSTKSPSSRAPQAPDVAARADLAGKVDVSWPASARTDSLQAEYDALADLFLSDERPNPADVLGTIGAKAVTPVLLSPAAPPQPVERPAVPKPDLPSEPERKGTTVPAARIEALILGHLPVLASAWAVQYSRHLAESLAHPIALARVMGGELLLELVFPDAESAQGARSQGPLQDLAGALATARTIAPRVLVRVDETSEPDLVSSPGADRVTILTGGDDMAVVSSYRTIKHFALDGSGSVRLSDDANKTTPIVGVAIMGADASKAALADQKLRRATLTFLGHGMEPATVVSKMGVCATALLYRGPWSEPITSLLGVVHEIWNSPLATASKPTPVKPTAEPVRETGPAAVATARLDSLARQIPGLTPLISRCPYCTAVELAADAQGALHLVVGAGELGTLPDATAAIGQLLSAASWAEDHALILSEAHQQLKAGPKSGGPVLHLLTDEPRSARSLLGTGIRIHLLKCIDVGGRRSWMCSDLN